jgi:hypothetical protein
VATVSPGENPLPDTATKESTPAVTLLGSRVITGALVRVDVGAGVLVAVAVEVLVAVGVAVEVPTCRFTNIALMAVREILAPSPLVSWSARIAAAGWEAVSATSTTKPAATASTPTFAMIGTFIAPLPSALRQHLVFVWRWQGTWLLKTTIPAQLEIQLRRG